MLNILNRIEGIIDELRVIFPLSFQQEASDVWIAMQDCHWYIWVYLTFVLVFVLMMFFFIIVDAQRSIRYASTQEMLFQRFVFLKFSRVTHISTIEFIWTTLPCFFLLFIGVRSIYTLYLTDSYLITNIVVKALGRQWFWQYEVVENHPEILMPAEFYVCDKNSLRLELTPEIKSLKPKYFDSYMAVVDSIKDGGRRNLKVDTTLALMVGFPVRFLTTSLDVLHSFALPVFGIKLDAVPGRLNACDAIIERHGLFYGQCSELCGQGHGYMPIAVYITNPFGPLPGYLRHE